MSDACFKCGKNGHWARECRTKSRSLKEVISVIDKETIRNKTTRCYLCRKLGHLARECPGTSSDVKYNEKYVDSSRSNNTEIERKIEEPPVPPPPSYNINNVNPYGEFDGTTITQAFESIEEREWDFIKENSEHKPNNTQQHKLLEFYEGDDMKFTKTVSLNGMKFTGFLDTGSEKCLMKYSAAKKAHLNVQLDDTDVMSNSLTFKGKIVSIGKATTGVSVDNVEIPNVEIFVVGDDVLNTEFVVGRSWLEHPNVILLKIENSIFISDATGHSYEKLHSILNILDVKQQPTVTTARKHEIRENSDNLSSDDEETRRKHRGNHHRHRHSSPEDTRRIRQHSFEREKSRDVVLRSRSRSRERRRYMERSRQSRERSRERYVSRR